jgi:hypothetical protein
MFPAASGHAPFRRRSNNGSTHERPDVGGVREPGGLVLAGLTFSLISTRPSAADPARTPWSLERGKRLDLDAHSKVALTIMHLVVGAAVVTGQLLARRSPR